MTEPKLHTPASQKLHSPAAPLDRSTTVPKTIGIVGASSKELAAICSQLSLPVDEDLVKSFNRLLLGRDPLREGPLKLTKDLGIAVSFTLESRTTIASDRFLFERSIGFDVDEDGPLYLRVQVGLNKADKNRFDIELYFDGESIFEEDDPDDIWSTFDHVLQNVSKLDKANCESIPGPATSIEAEHRACARVSYWLQPMPERLVNPGSDYDDEPVKDEVSASPSVEPTIPARPSLERLVPYSLKISDLSNDLIRATLSTVGLDLLAERLTDSVLNHFRDHISGEVFQPETLWQHLPQYPGELEISVSSSLETGFSPGFDEEVDEVHREDEELEEKSQASAMGVQNDDDEFEDSVAFNDTDTALEAGDPVFHSVYLSAQPGSPCPISIEFGQDTPKYDTAMSDDFAPPTFFLQISWDYASLAVAGIPEQIDTSIRRVRELLAKAWSIQDNTPDMEPLVEPVGPITYQSLSFPLGEHRFVINRTRTDLPVE